jgi:hypothetical protein
VQTEKDNSVYVEFYIADQVRPGWLSVARGRRLLDLLNGSSYPIRDGQSEYIEFFPSKDAGNDAEDQPRYVRKAMVDMVALFDPNLARGAGSQGATIVFPKMEKQAVRVNVEMTKYVLVGAMHCPRGHSIRDVLDEKALFLPLTDVTIQREGRACGDRPFVAVRKDRIALLAKDRLTGV